jgi:AraC-like DNA-binding protein
LQEARQLLTIQKVPVNEAAFKVGYESPSQFSREYSRMYGKLPKSDVKNEKTMV